MLFGIIYQWVTQPHPLKCLYRIQETRQRAWERTALPIESATYISDLNIAYPVHGDSVGVGDSHLRLIKAVLQNTFPNIGATAVTSTALQLNNPFPIGGIITWYGANLSVPIGWGICNGTTYLRSDGGGNIISPNLTDKVVVGAGGLYAQGSAGGTIAVTPLVTCSPFSVAQANLPAYALAVTDPGHVHSIVDPGHTHTASVGYIAAQYAFGSVGALAGSSATNTGSNTTGISVSSHTTGITVNSGGSGTAITVAATSGSVSTLQPYLALYQIMKI